MSAVAVIPKSLNINGDVYLQRRPAISMIAELGAAGLCFPTLDTNSHHPVSGP